MRSILCGLAVVSLIGAGLGAQAPASRAALAADLGRLTVPAAALPATCTPGAPNKTFDSNPAFVTDPNTLGLMYVLLFGEPGDAAATRPPTPSDARKQAAEWLAARTADVEAGYAATYEEQGGSPEIGVFALRMKKMPATAGTSTGNRAGTRIIKGSVAIFYWSDATQGSPDRGCLDVVRKHIESVDVR